MYKVTLTKLAGGTRIRTDDVTGTCDNRPEVGKSFQLIAEPLVEGSVARIVTTSTVQNIIEQDDSIILETLNSKYQLYFN